MNKWHFDWHTRYKIRSVVRTSFCLIPVLAIVAAAVAGPVIRYLDDYTRWELVEVSADAARSVVGTLPSALLSLIVFSMSILLLAVQLVSSQFSPRVIARFFEDRSVKWILGIFVFSHTYSLFALARIEERVPVLPILFALILNLISLAVFLYMIQIVGRGFRAITILTLIAADTKQVILTLFPQPYSLGEATAVWKKTDQGNPDRLILSRKPGGVFVAFDQAGLVRLAARHGCVVELAAAVGEYVSDGEPLFRIYGAGASSMSERLLMRCVALDLERTLEQDPDFGFRMIVDIASKALSPAINDPTTGTLAVDQLQHLLELLGNRQLDTGIASDDDGAVRLIFPFCGWEDFVALAATEIRVYGGPNPQVTRRLQAMYNYLLTVLPEPRKAAIQREIELLKQTVEQSYANNQDREIASTPDFQGFGARRH